MPGKCGFPAAGGATHLRRASGLVPCQVLGLEAQPSAPHSYGSSHGLSRIIRLSYFEHPSYVPLVREAYRLWRGLEQESGERLLTMTGCINTSPPDADCGPGTSCFQGALRSGKSSSKLLPCCDWRACMSWAHAPSQLHCPLPTPLQPRSTAWLTRC